MPEVVVLARSFGRASSEPLEILEKAGLSVTFKSNPEPENESMVAELIGNAEAVIVGVDRIGEKVLSLCSHLKVISKHGIGVDNIDLEAARRRGVIVANAPGTNSESVADMTFLFILSCARHMKLLLEQVRNKKWSSPLLGSELEGKTLGIVGLGRIGKGVARRALGFGMKVIYFDPFVEDTDFTKVELEELFRLSDFVTLHLPLSLQTKHLVNERLLSLMKKEAFLINTARGELVDEEALYRFLKEERIAGAGLDVLSFEPPFESPLLTLPNVLVTPHVSAHTREANVKMGKTAALNVVYVLEGKEPLYRVV
ncbi:MAG: phosphoglycerate dehydrogenase [Candidatus Atribacteria bacterium]|nr:phosphoglycerate dehydrogenase [Candidatus Atribacteria bacterium]